MTLGTFRIMNTIIEEVCMDCTDTTARQLQSNMLFRVVQLPHELVYHDISINGSQYSETSLIRHSMGLQKNVRL